jgi:hypothetical protein
MKAPIRLVGAVVLVVAGYALFRFVIFPSSAQLSAEQLATLQTLEPRLPELVVSQADAFSIAGEVRDCVGQSPAAPPLVDPAQGKRADSAWCSAAGAFVMSTVALPAEGSVANVAREVQLHADPAGRAQSMAEAIAGQLTPLEGSAQFIELPSIGPYSHALKFRAQYPGRVQVFEYYSVHFVENFVDVDITLALPGAPANDQSAATIAQTIYDRVGQVLAQQAIPTITP